MFEIERQTFDGAVIDNGLHNQGFDLCTELRSLDVPYITCNAPHELQKPSAKKRDAKKVVASLMTAMRAQRCFAAPSKTREHMTSF